ncbi:farnesyl-diphosphate farnesyltransferase 1 [Capsaspora owczarzaki ATCC 30864]|nr:farnesyl-diphosphate farnesyltransferase 1 [Capsaspora owczarzaki ATCC 30864]|eukprot:XP_004346713.1 farnesyl-diphosphate farnesyltransferase 1 [Capsaspora owczarzaki ATCC 30864]
MASLILHPDELWALCKFKFLGGQQAIMPKNDLSALPESMQKCYRLLEATSRSFAAVIQALDGELRPAICIFYLVLRGLDTIEDDMTLANEVKVPLLVDFHEIIYKTGWTFNGNGPDEADRHLLVDFDVVIAEFLKLRPAYQEVIADITKRMGLGMSKFLGAQVHTKDDYNEYCHYVAGLVGIGLSKIFAASGLESEAVGTSEHLSNSMGLFLQKTNIIRDYLEDIIDGRIFWPRAVWIKYAPNGKLDDFRAPENKAAALACLNDLVTDALAHIPDVFAYMSSLRNQSVFNFCAIPQVMAIATLALVYDNHQVFTRTGVKIRKALAVKLMMGATNMPNLYAIFGEFLANLESRVRTEDPSYEATVAAIERAKVMLRAGLIACPSQPEPSASAKYSQAAFALGLVAAGVWWARRGTAIAV